MISPCAEAGCSMLCIGLFCIAHAPRPDRDLPRGRPWPPIAVGLERAARVPAARVAVAQAVGVMPVRSGA